MIPENLRTWPVIFMSSQLLYVRINSHVMVLELGAFGRWLSHVGEDLMSGISECPYEKDSMWGHSEKTAIYEPGRKLSPDKESASVLTLYFPASGIVWNARLLFKSPSLRYFCYKSLNILGHLDIILEDFDIKTR